jgi:CheY-like chemotaxis protein
MSKKYRYVWIEDNADRETDCMHLERNLGVKCDFINVQPKDVDFLSMINKIKPDLILMDHNLTDIGTGNIKKGSTIAALLREKEPTFAIVCITGQDIADIDSQQRLLYDAIFNITEIKDNYQTIKSIAVSYRKMKAAPINKVQVLFSLMKVPFEDQIRLEAILPRDIKENFQYSSISYWIRNLLMDRPGFLYDKLWAATLLGLKENGFNKVERLFTAAKYKGIFSDKSKERWWKSELIKILSKHVNSPGLPWEKGRLLPKINARNFSKDYYSNFREEYPETVAYTDETSNERVQMKLKYTVPHPKFDKLLFFEEIRMMKAD